MEERRQFVRLDTRLPMAYRVLPSSRSVQAVTKDISGSGICLFVSEPLAKGTNLQVDITLPDRERPITFTGEVVWCEECQIIGKTRHERSVEAGLRFLQIDPRDQQAIMNYVILSLRPQRQA